MVLHVSGSVNIGRFLFIVCAMYFLARLIRWHQRDPGSTGFFFKFDFGRTKNKHVLEKHPFWATTVALPGDSSDIWSIILSINYIVSYLVNQIVN